MRFVGHSSQGLCDSGFTAGAKDADDAISHRGHNLGRIVRSDGGTVFTKGDVTDIVGAVFNVPPAEEYFNVPSELIDGCDFFSSEVVSVGGNSAEQYYGIVKTMPLGLTALNRMQVFVVFSLIQQTKEFPSVCQRSKSLCHW